MAEGEAIVSGACDGGEGTGTRTRMVGGSLPPRKRLLAGLKQNGSWLASTSPVSPTSHTSVQRIDGGCRFGAGSVLRSFIREGLTGETKVGCMSCGAPDNDARKGKGNGLVKRFCDFCSFSINKNLNCCRCQGLYPDVKDPEGWLECRRCRRLVHVECEQSVPPEGVPYTCLDCVDVKMDNKHGNALLSTGGPPVCPGSDSKAETGHCVSPTSAECSNSRHKKLRISRESRSKSNDADGDDIGQFGDVSHSTEVLLGRKSSSSKEAAAAAAASAASLAGRAAAAAKASAAAKAATAVRAAAIAKAALDAAALAARVEAQVRGELRRKSASSERAAVGDVKVSATEFQLGKERPEERTEDLGIFSVSKLSSIDDEELARQLHRAINSSPRISNGLTPLRRKPSTKPALMANASHAVVSWPRLGSSAESQPRLQMKQQQTRPRSLQLKELKLTDNRDVKLESKQSSENNRIKLSQVAPGNQLLALKAEPVDSSTITLVGQDSETILIQGATSTPSTVATKGIGEVNGGTVLFGLDENQDRVLAGTDVSQAAALLDEVLIYEAETDKVSKDELLSAVQDRTDANVIEGLGATATTTIEGATSPLHPRFCEQNGLEKTRGCPGKSNASGVAALAQVASNAIESLETRDKSVCVAVVNAPWSIACDANRSGGSCAGAVKARLSTTSVPSEDSSDFESSLDSFPKPSSVGKEEKVIATEAPRAE